MTSAAKQYQKLDEGAACYYLAQLDPARKVGPQLREELLRWRIDIVIETVCLRRRTRGVEVSLFRRKSGETYEGQWHVSGTQRFPNESLTSTFKRIQSKYGFEFSFEPIWVSWYDDPKNKKGHTLHFIWVVGEVTVLNHNYQYEQVWLPVNRLRKTSGVTVIEHHIEHLIPMAARKFNAP